MSNRIAHRRVGYALLTGKGLEVGAGSAPAVLPPDCLLEHCDLVTPSEARTLFPEMTPRHLERIPEPDWVVDVGVDGLSFCASGSLDFVIANHLLEQVVDPIWVLAEFDRVLRPGGRMALSASDKHHSEERLRAPIDFSSLQESHLAGPREPVPSDYLDILRYMHPELLVRSEGEIQNHLRRFLQRREHLHVWTSDLFLEFFERSMDLLESQYQKILEVTGDHTHIECFMVVEKTRSRREKS